MAASSQTIGTGLSALYERRFLRSLRKSVKAKEQILQRAGIDVQRGVTATGFYQFDDVITAPLHGFSGAEDYYYRASACRVLHEVTVPTLMLQSADDPLLGAKCMPVPEAVSSTIEIETTERGGHVGFVYGTPWKPKFYIEERAMLFLEKAFL